VTEAADIRLTSEIAVRLIDSMGGDGRIVAAARASTQGAASADTPDDEAAGLINYLMKHRHGTPFEHGALTAYIHAPAFVWWEWVRHRIGTSFNLESARYKTLEPVFWMPRRERPMMLPARGYTPARPHFEPAEDDFEYEAVIYQMRHAYRSAWANYKELVNRGVANEVARAVLGFGVYYSGWVTCNPRSLMHFLSLRTHDPAARYPSFPQAEIAEAARAVEAIFAEGWPITFAAFNKHGRVAP
jgi:thymidylate synthase (FAD)